MWASRLSASKPVNGEAKPHPERESQTEKDVRAMYPILYHDDLTGSWKEVRRA